jgi:hypothetical protein
VKRYTAKGMTPQMINEIVMLSTLRHPAIMRPLHFRRERGVEIVMPRGQDMRDAPPADPSGHLLQVLQGLNYLHSRDIIHGDIKSENVLVVDGAALIIDFGGSLRDVGQDMTQICTEEICAPEQLYCPGPMTSAVDMWAFGRLIQELVHDAEWLRLADECLYLAPERRITAEDALLRFDVKEEVYETHEFVPVRKAATEEARAWLAQAIKKCAFHAETENTAVEIYERAVAAGRPAIPCTIIAAIFIASCSIESNDVNTIKRIIDESRKRAPPPTVKAVEDEVWSTLSALEFKILQ